MPDAKITGTKRSDNEMKANYNGFSLRGGEKRRKTAGFSMIELIIVLIIVAVLSAISLPYIYQSRRVYRSEDQALKVMDLMREAAQLAITRRRTFRLEVDTTSNLLLIIDENGAGAADDTEIKAIPLDPVNEVRMDTLPTGVTKPNPPNYNDAAFAVDATGHKRAGATIVGDTVWAARFNRDGSVVNAAGNPINANLYFYPPQTAGSTTPRNKVEVRAITMFGGNGAVRFWKHNGTTFVAYN